MQVAAPTTPQVWHPLAGNRDHLMTLHAARQRVAELLSADGWNIDAAPQRRLRETDERLTNEVVAVTLEEGVLADVEDDEQVAPPDAGPARMPFTADRQGLPRV